MAGRDAAIAMYRAMQETVDEVGKVTADEGIDCHWAKGGTVELARSAAQLERATAGVQEARTFGFGEDDLRVLTAAEAREIASATDVLGGTYAFAGVLAAAAAARRLPAPTAGTAPRCSPPSPTRCCCSCRIRRGCCCRSAVRSRSQ